MEKAVISSLNPQTPRDPGAQGQTARWFQGGSPILRPLSSPGSSLDPPPGRPLRTRSQLSIPAELLGRCPQGPGSSPRDCLPPVRCPPSSPPRFPLPQPHPPSPRGAGTRSNRRRSVQAFSKVRTRQLAQSCRDSGSGKCRDSGSGKCRNSYWRSSNRRRLQDARTFKDPAADYGAALGSELPRSFVQSALPCLGFQV